MRAIKIYGTDNVAVATAAIEAGECVEIEGGKVTLLTSIPGGHKFAIKPIKEGEAVVKYGFTIGFAKAEIAVGEHVHTQNVKSNVDSLLEYEYHPSFEEAKPVEQKYFMGYKRDGGEVGIRNEVWIIPTVGCVNSVVREIEKESQKFVGGSLEGIYAYNHPYGCSQLGDDMYMTLDYLSGLIRHPNAAGVLVVGLGCENGNIGELKKRMGEYDENRVKFLTSQEVEDEIAAGVAIVGELAERAKTAKREKCPLSALTVGLKCGGSDGFSGITANPLLGRFSDILIGMGGSSILTEVPEMFGAETILMDRCRTKDEFDKTVSLINDFKSYFMKYGERIDENPSPGNKAGGITTLADKSLGCTQKGGTAPVEDVLKYGEPVKRKGLSLLQAPGNDLVASNALAASGAHLVLFTTGRGTPFGCPVPTVKISSNSPLADKKHSWIDFNAGRLLDGVTLDDLADEFTDYIIALASGEVHAKSEALDKHELAIFKDGVTL